MAIQHTPAPWEKDSDRSIWGQGQPIAKLYRFEHPSDETEQDGNADLVRYAPWVPHECDTAECPGNRVLAFMRTFVASVDYHRKHGADGVETVLAARNAAHELITEIESRP